jgi:hypothetical protein
MGESARDQIIRFAAAVWEPGDLVEVRLLPGGRQTWHVANQLHNQEPGLRFANENGENIYIGINPRNKQGGKGEDVLLARMLMADFDDCTPEQAAEKAAAAGLPPATLIVNSGHGAHHYWRLTQAVEDLKRWTRAVKALIARCGSDKTIFDPPRILRLPGFFNVKEEPHISCEIIGGDPSLRYAIERVAGPEESWLVEEERIETGSLAWAAGDEEINERMRNLSRATMAFVISGGPEGKRQKLCFDAACDMAGNGIPQSCAEPLLVVAAMRSGGKDEGPARQAVRSAYSKPRSPSRPPGCDDDEGPATALQRGASVMVEDVAVTSEAGTPIVPPAEVVVEEKPGERFKVFNVTDHTWQRALPNGTKETCKNLKHVTLPEIYRQISEGVGKWPRRAGGMLFALHPKDEPLPDHTHLHWLAKTDDLFGWLGIHADCRWTSKECTHRDRKGEVLNPPTKNELHAYLKAKAQPEYRGVEFLPHWPPIKNIFYLPCKLPAIIVKDGVVSDGPLNRLIDRLNPDTDLDRLLLLSALLTPGWGGPPGARPAFILASDHGRGAGKTATATALADVWGGAVGIGGNEDWDQVKKRLLGDEALSKRICLIDNIKGKLSGADLEAAITTAVLDGWRPYFGGASRPNLLTWYLTSNSPSLSRDLAERSIIIKIGPQKHDSDFVSWAQTFVAENRAAIIAQALAYLGRPNQCKIERENRDRWHAWQEGVLRKLEWGNELAKLAIERRPDVDGDLDDAVSIAAAVMKLIQDHFPIRHLKIKVRITRQQLYSRLLHEGVIDRGFGLKSCTSWVRERCNAGPLSFLSDHRTNDSRTWLYTGPDAPPGSAPEEVPVSAEEERIKRVR